MISSLSIKPYRLLQGLLLFALLLHLLSSQAQSIPESNVPHTVWSRKSGGIGADRAEGIACEFNGNMYVTGCYNSSNLSGTEAFVNVFQGGTYDGYLMKMDRYGNALWAVYIGGTADDYCTAVEIDNSGNVIVVGYTSSSDFNPSQTANTFNGGPHDAFCASYTSDGELLWSTYLGGAGADYAYDLDINSNNDIYVIGNTNSTGLPQTPSYQSGFGGGTKDGFMAGFNSNGENFSFAYFGGTGMDEIADITIDANDRILLCGYTMGMTILDAISPNSYGGGSSDAFIACLDETQNMVWGQYIGGTGKDTYNTLAIDGSGNIVASGNTSSGSTASIPGSEMLQYNNQDGIITSFNENGIALWHQFITGSVEEDIKDIHVDVFGNIYIGGTTSSNNLNVLNPFQDTPGGGIDNHISKWNSEGELQWMTYLGGTDDEGIFHLSTDRFGKIMVSGFTYSLNYGNDIADESFGASDAFISRISDCANPEVIIHTYDDTTFCDGGGALLTACGANHYEWMNEDTLNLTNVDTTMICFVKGFNTEGCYGMSRLLTIESKLLPEVAIIPLGPTTFCGEGEVTLVATGADTYAWNDLNESTTDSITVNTPHMYVVTGTGENGCKKSESMEVEINELPEVVMSCASDTVCISGAPVPLIGLPEGGTFTGDGTFESSFLPDVAGGGIHHIAYSFTDENGCSNTSDSISIEVFFYPTVLFVANDTLCTFDPVMQLTGSPEGGTFSGDGVVDNFFHPELPGTGPQNITYSYVDSHGCINTDSDIIYLDACIIEAVNEMQQDEFAVYPNPATTSFTISNLNSAYITATLLESSGKIIHTYNGWSNLKIDSSDLPAGYYYIQISNNENITTKPIIITK